MLKLTFLGTSAGVPTKQRNVTALAIECLNSHAEGSSKKRRPWILIDCGEGTQQQLLQTKLSLHQLTAICITHVHGDHCYGLPGLLASAAMSGRTTPLTIIAPKAIATLLDAVTLTTELYFPFTIDFIAIEDVLLQAQPQIHILLEEQQLVIDITALSHRVPSHAFGITQTIHHSVLDVDKLQSEKVAAGRLWGRLLRGEDVYSEEGRQLFSKDYVLNNEWRTRIVVAGDNDNPELLYTAVREADLLVHEATYTSALLTKIQAKNADFDPMHSSARQVGQFAQDSTLDYLILTHFSARYQSFDNPNSETPNMSHIRLDARSVYKGMLWLAADFAQFMVNPEADNRVVYLGSALATPIIK